MDGYGLILEGGGAKGAYHIGAYKAILEENIPIRGVSGTSVGALNGALIAQGDFEKAYSIWENMKYSDVIAIDDDMVKRFKNNNIKKQDLAYMGHNLKKLIKDRGLDIDPLEKLIDELLDEDRLRASKMDFGMVTFSLSDFEPVEILLENIGYGEVKKFLLASAYLPAFKTQRLDGKFYLDGGFYNNLPIGILKDKGYKNFILIRTHATGNIKKINTDGLNIISIAPSESLGKMMDFDDKSTKHGLELGYYDALRTLRSYKGFLYYIDGDGFDVFRIFKSLNNKDIDSLKSIFNIKSFRSRDRVFFERIIPEISKLLKLEKSSSYEDMIIRILEQTASIYGLDRFKIYRKEDFIDRIKFLIRADYLKNKTSFKLDRYFMTDKEKVKNITKILLKIN